MSERAQSGADGPQDGLVGHRIVLELKVDPSCSETDPASLNLR